MAYVTLADCFNVSGNTYTIPFPPHISVPSFKWETLSASPSIKKTLPVSIAILAVSLVCTDKVFLKNHAIHFTDGQLL